MKVIIERHENEKEKTYKFKCIECGSEIDNMEIKYGK